MGLVVSAAVISALPLVIEEENEPNEESTQIANEKRNQKASNPKKKEDIARAKQPQTLKKVTKYGQNFGPKKNSIAKQQPL